MEPDLSNHSQDMESSLQQNDNAILEAPVNISNRASTTTKVTRNQKDVPEKILNILERRATQPLSTGASIGASLEDDDVKFLLSFRGDMKRMSPSQKLDFKIEMLQLVKRTINNNQSSYSRPSTAYHDANPSDSSYSRPSTANSVTYISSPSPSSNRSVQAPTSSLIPCATGFAPTQPRFVQSSQNVVNIVEQNSIMDNNDYDFNSIDNSQVVVINSEHEPIQTYLTFKK